MKKLIITLVIIIALVGVVFLGWNYLSKKSVQAPTTETENAQLPIVATSSDVDSLSQTQNQQGQNIVQLSEQPNQAKYDEYLTSFYLGRMAIGKAIGTDGFPVQTNLFTKGADKFCTMMELKKTVMSGHVAIAIYDTVSKSYQQAKAVFPMELKAGGVGGCDNLYQPVGKFEYKLYLDDVLAVVLPFEVK